MNISVLILTLNEEINLQRCLDSLSWCDDIIVLDSYSTDNTDTIARNAGTRFFQRKFDDYAKQRNFGLNKIEYKHSWVLMVDADETVSPELLKEIIALPDQTEKDICIYQMRRKDHFMGRWIKHSSGYPTWFGRLLKTGRIWVERSINEEYHTDGETEFLQNHLIHYPFNKGFHSWFEKHNRYSTMEAEKKIRDEKAKNNHINLRDIIESNPVIRRKVIKNFVYSLPLRPILMFLALYFMRRGFLEGRAGLTFCILRSFYEYMIDCKVKELRLRNMDLPL